MLRQTFTNANMRTERELKVKYVVDVEANSYVYRRLATKSYSFVGMTLEAARACAAAKTAQYTRNYAILPASGNGRVYVSKCGASIAVVHSRGSAFDCRIEVSEVDLVRITSLPQDPKELFIDENARAYDDDFNDMFKFSNVDVVVTKVDPVNLLYTVTVSFTHTFGERFDLGAVSLQFKHQSTQEEWSNLPIDQTFVRDGKCYLLTFPVEWNNWIYYRLTYGPHESDTIVL